MKAEQLKSRWALVTGASSGLGADFARLLASRGCHLVLTARRANRLENLQNEIQDSHDVQAAIIPIDLSTIDAPLEIYKRVKMENIKIDVLVNNAGFGVYGEFIETQWNRQKEMLVLNMISLTHLTQLFLTDMLDRGFGYILNIASNSAYQPTPRYAAYAASKSFVLNFSEALSYELKDTNVSCTVLSPGTIDTEFHTVSGQSKDTFYYRFTRMDSMMVARSGLEAMLKGKPSHVVDWKIALASWLNQRGPRRLATAIAGWMTKPG
jgi:short-subunit dehydrogenase